MAEVENEYSGIAFLQNSLFRGGPNTELNACVGDNGGPYDLLDYGKGFFDGAQEIITAVRNGSFYVDILVYPICFSFRHGIELYLKAILPLIRELSGNEERMKKNHDIDVYWAAISAEIIQIDDIADKTEVGIASDIIADFVQIDPTGQVFRYPEDLKGNRHLSELRLINVEVLSDGMKVLQGFLESWYYNLEGRIRYIRENSAGA